MFFFAEFIIAFFCPTSWVILKQLDPPPSRATDIGLLTCSPFGLWVYLLNIKLFLKDFGKDIKSVNNLIKKHQLLEADITSHEERVNEMLVQAAEFVEADHFEKDDIEDRAKAVAERSVSCR